VKLLVERGEEQLTLEVVPRKIPRYETGEAGLFPRVRLRFAQVVPDSPAERAGLEAGDVVLAAGGQQVAGFQDFIELVKSHADQPLELEIQRGEERILTTVTPETRDEGVQIGVLLSIYRRLPLGEALVASVRFNIDIIVKSVEILGKLFTTELAPKSALSGPIEIANWAGQAAQRGFKDLIYMMGFLSVSIGFMNLLPIPLLDGGHIALLLVESLRRRDLSWVTKERFNQVGFFLLVGLMITVIFFDLSKNLPGLFSG
jgi:regulator of sigma E protease